MGLLTDKAVDDAVDSLAERDRQRGQALALALANEASASVYRARRRQSAGRQSGNFHDEEDRPHAEDR